MEQRYNSLRTVGLVFKVLGILVIVGALILVGLTFVGAILGGGGPFNNDRFIVLPILLAMAIPVVLAGFGGFVSLYAIGEVLCLLVDLEENTRDTVFLLEKLLDRDQEEKG